MSEQPVVRLRGVSKRFGTTLALNDVSLDIMPGTIVGVLGPNGSGKTTLMGHLPGLLLPTAGTVETFGTPAARLDDAQLGRIGYVSQEPRLMDWLTVAELTDFVRAGRPSWDDALATRLLKDFGLDPDKSVSALSPGLRQRLAILLAVAPRPDLLLLDEPAASLDPVARHDFLQLVMELIQDGDRTILISSHVLSDVEKVVDTVLVINNGQLHCHQPLDELRETYHRVDLTRRQRRAARPAAPAGPADGDRRPPPGHGRVRPRAPARGGGRRARPRRRRPGARPGVRGDLPADRDGGREEGMSIPTIVPRDLLPRPEWTVLRIAVTTAIPILVLVALLMQGVPPQFMLIVLLMIGSQVSLALAQGQKELLAATTSYFRPGLGPRVGQAQLLWGLALPALTAAVYGALVPAADLRMLGSIVGLAMVIHALMSWATFRLWWAFQLPAWAFYSFFVPMAVRKAAVVGWLLQVMQHPLPWLAIGGAALALLVRFTSSRNLQRRLHDTIVLGPEAYFSPAGSRPTSSRAAATAAAGSGPCGDGAPWPR